MRIPLVSLATLVLLMACEPLTLKEGLATQVDQYLERQADSTPPSAISSGSATASSPTAITLTFSPPGDADYAKTLVTFTPTASGVTQPVVVTAGNSSVVISGLARTTTYSFSLASQDSNGNKAAGFNVTGKTEPVVTTVATGLSAADKTTMATDSSGNLYYTMGNPAASASGTFSIKMVTPSGVVSTAYSATGFFPRGLGVNPAGDKIVYADANGAQLVTLTKTSGVWSAGTPVAFSQPAGVTLDASGVAYFTTQAIDGVVKTLNGTTISDWGTPVNAGNGAATQYISFDPNFTKLVVAEAVTYSLRFFDSNGTFLYWSNLFKLGNSSWYGTAGAALNAAGDLFVTVTPSIGYTGTNEIRMVPAANVAAGGLTTTVVAGQLNSTTQTDGPASTATFKDARGLAFDHSGNLFVVDYDRIRKIAF